MIAGAVLAAEVKLGELVAAIPDKKASSGGGTRSLPEGITKKQSYEYQTLAKHPDIIEQVKAEAVENDDLPTKTEVLRRIKAQEKAPPGRLKTVVNERFALLCKFLLWFRAALSAATPYARSVTM